jgi:hypothetical protein
MDIQMEELALHLHDHIAAEERWILPVAQALDSADLGQRFTARREQLLNLSHA